METIIELCPIHGKTEFSVDKKGRKRCKKCNYESVAKKRKNYKQILVEYKGGKCEICGYDKCIEALDFHHKDPTQKDFNISASKICNIETLKKEVDKCMLLCANCHREIHYKIRQEKEKKKEEEKEKNKVSFYNENNYIHKTNDSFNYLNYESIINDINNGLPKKEIYKKNHITGKTLNKFLEKNNISYNKKKNAIPPKDVLSSLIKEKSFVEIGKIYNVTDNAVRKWCKKYDLPFRKKDIKNQ
jgi:hypothetical protein